MRKPIIAGNWKLNKTVSAAVSLVKNIENNLSEPEIEVVVCPVYTALTEVGKLLQSSFIKLGAQNVFWENKGAYTGEISPMMLKDVGCEYVIIGHSERRQYFGETNSSVNKKVKASLQSGLKTIMCVGEKLEEREAGNTFDIVKEHVAEGLKDIKFTEIEKKLVLAYEPVWAIGTGKTATKEQAQEVHEFIRGLLADIYGETSANKIIIQYGGSVKSHNIKELIMMSDVDGALVGGASLDATSFSQTVEITDKVYKESKVNPVREF